MAINENGVQVERQYIGARYVPKFFEGIGRSPEWVAGLAYEALTIVTYLGNSFTSKVPVPAGVGNPADNPTYWVNTGNYNAQVDAYRKEVETFKIDIEQQINEIEAQIVSYFFTNVAALKESETIKNGDTVRTNGYYETNDKGAGFYIIRNTLPTDIDNGLTLILKNNLTAELIYGNFIYPEMVGAHGDGMTPDDLAFSTAISTGVTVICAKYQYLLNEQLVVPDNMSILGCTPAFGLTKLIAPNGVWLKGTNICFKYFNLEGSDQTGTAIKCSGRNMSSANPSDRHFTRSTVSDVIISNYEYGIKLDAVVWGVNFSNFRINFCNYGLYSDSTYGTQTTTFTNLYFSGSKINNMLITNGQYYFVSCNFGFSVAGAILIQQGAYASFDSCSFECDKQLDTNGPLIAIGGVLAKFVNCAFVMNGTNQNWVFTGGSALESLVLENCYFKIAGGTGSRFMQNAFQAKKYGAVRVTGSPSIPIETSGANKIQDSSMSYFIYEDMSPNMIAATQGSIDTTKCIRGNIFYIIATNKFVYYNGTSLVEL